MNRLLNFICSSAVMIATCSSGFADTNEVGQSSQSNQSSQPKPAQAKGKQQPPPFEQGMGLSDTNMPANKYQPAYNAPACIDVKGGWDVDAFGSFIYWHVSQENMDIAFTPGRIGTTETRLNIANQKFKYKPGFKVGLGLDLNYDGWVSWAEYTWLHQTVSDSFGPPNTNNSLIVNDWFTNNWFASTLFDQSLGASFLASKWTMKLDMVDAVFSRPYYEGMQLTVSPYAGMRGLWLRQKMFIDISTTEPASLVTSASAVMNSSSNSWALGPVAGVLGHWMLGAGFRFEGNSAVSLLYTRYTKIRYRELDPFPSAFINLKSTASSFSVLRPALQMGIGLGWGTYFSNGGYYIDLSARYDFSYFWGQNVMRQFAESLVGQASPAGDLEMHGLTATVRMDF